MYTRADLIAKVVGLSPTVGEHPRSASLRTSSLAFYPTESKLTAGVWVVLCVSKNNYSCPFGLVQKVRFKLTHARYRDSPVPYLLATSADLPHLTLTDSY